MWWAPCQPTPAPPRGPPGQPIAGMGLRWLPATGTREGRPVPRIPRHCASQPCTPPPPPTPWPHRDLLQVGPPEDLVPLLLAPHPAQERGRQGPADLSITPPGQERWSHGLPLPLPLRTPPRQPECELDEQEGEPDGEDQAGQGVEERHGGVGVGGLDVDPGRGGAGGGGGGGAQIDRLIGYISIPSGKAQGGAAVRQLGVNPRGCQSWGPTGERVRMGGGVRYGRLGVPDPGWRAWRGGGRPGEVAWRANPGTETAGVPGGRAPRSGGHGSPGAVGLMRSRAEGRAPLPHPPTPPSIHPWRSPCMEPMWGAHGTWTGQHGAAKEVRSSKETHGA